MAKAQSTLNVWLRPELTDFVSARIATGRYQSASEGFRAGLRLLEREESDWLQHVAETPRFDVQRCPKLAERLDG